MVIADGLKGMTQLPLKSQQALKNDSCLGMEMPDANGFFGKYGGSFIPSELEPIMKKLTEEYLRIRDDPEFLEELSLLRRTYVGRPSPVYYCRRLREKIGGARIYLKREDLNHTGSHKINHTIAEALMAKKMGKTKLLAETGAGQHGVAVATAAALVGLECELHMGEVDIQKEFPNVQRMQILGAKVVAATHGAKALKEAVDSAFNKFKDDHENTFLAVGSTVAYHPYPMMVRDFQAIIGFEAKQQFAEMRTAEGKNGEKLLPDHLVACIGGGSNSIGLFTAFLDDTKVAMHGVEPAGRDLNTPGEHAASLTLGKPHVLHGYKSYCLLNPDGEPDEVYSIASGLDYPSVGPQQALLKDLKRVQYHTATDDEVIEAFFELSRTEGIIPALESAHGVAHALKMAKELPPTDTILVSLSGRGDKDLSHVIQLYGEKYGIDKSYAKQPEY
eukprot:Clim_evm15s142 gene=Clim_evmTU15s142